MKYEIKFQLSTNGKNPAKYKEIRVWYNTAAETLEDLTEHEIMSAADALRAQVRPMIDMALEKAKGEG